MRDASYLRFFSVSQWVSFLLLPPGLQWGLSSYTHTHTHVCASIPPRLCLRAATERPSFSNLSPGGGGTEGQPQPLPETSWLGCMVVIREKLSERLLKRQSMRQLQALTLCCLPRGQERREMLLPTVGSVPLSLPILPFTCTRLSHEPPCCPANQTTHLDVERKWGWIEGHTPDAVFCPLFPSLGFWHQLVSRLAPVP